MTERGSMAILAWGGGLVMREGRRSARLARGDRVMETQNDYDREVFNGDLGMVVRIDDEEGALIASFDGREVSYPFGELDTLVPAYATTIPTSQGSEDRKSGSAG